VEERTDITKLMGAFRDYAKARKKYLFHFDCEHVDPLQGPSSRQ
jgi:hypothetical protein